MTFDECHSTLAGIRQRQGTRCPLVRVDYAGRVDPGSSGPRRQRPRVCAEARARFPYGVIILENLGLASVAGNDPPDRRHSDRAPQRTECSLIKTKSRQAKPRTPASTRPGPHVQGLTRPGWGASSASRKPRRAEAPLLLTTFSLKNQFGPCLGLGRLDKPEGDRPPPTWREDPRGEFPNRLSVPNQHGVPRRNLFRSQEPQPSQHFIDVPLPRRSGPPSPCPR